MYKRRMWRGNTIISYWHKGTKFCIAMQGKFGTLDEMAAAVTKGHKYILRVVKEN